MRSEAITARGEAGLMRISQRISCVLKDLWYIQDNKTIDKPIPQRPAVSAHGCDGIVCFRRPKSKDLVLAVSSRPAVHRGNHHRWAAGPVFLRFRQNSSDIHSPCDQQIRHGRKQQDSKIAQNDSLSKSKTRMPRTNAVTMKAGASIVSFDSNASFSPLRGNRMTCVKIPMLTMLS